MPPSKNPTERAARFVYLNKTCFNGLYRENKEGTFNVPVGSYKNPSICDASNLRNCHKVLDSVDIVACEFDKIDIFPNAVIYCDPPYHENYNQYQKGMFDERAQITLRDKAMEWKQKGCFVVLSNSNTEFIRRIYDVKHFSVRKIDAPRSVSCKSEGRQKVSELLITSK